VLDFLILHYVKSVQNPIVCQLLNRKLNYFFFSKSIVLCFVKNQAKQMGTEEPSENELIKVILGKGQGSIADLQAYKVNICQQFTLSYEMEVKHQHLACL